MRLNLGPINFRAATVGEPTQFYDRSFPAYIDFILFCSFSFLICGINLFLDFNT